MNSAAARRRKRTLDIFLSVLFVVTLPIGIWFVRHKRRFMTNLLHVIMGERSWVGYAPSSDKSVRLPRIREGVLDPVHAAHLVPMPLTIHRVNLTYAKDYRVWQDLRLVLANFSGLGR